MIKNKTYRNFCIIWNKLQKVKGYEEEEARKLAHLVFENVENDKGRLDRDAEYFFNMILPADEYHAIYG